MGREKLKGKRGKIEVDTMLMYEVLKNYIYKRVHLQMQEKYWRGNRYRSPNPVWGRSVCSQTYSHTPNTERKAQEVVPEAYFAADNRNNSSSLEIPPKLGNSVDPTADSVLGAAARHWRLTSEPGPAAQYVVLVLIVRHFLNRRPENWRIRWLH